MVKWNSEAIERLTETVVDSLRKLNDDELAYVVGVLYEDNWERHLRDEGFKAIVNALSILGLASYGLRRAEEREG